MANNREKLFNMLESLLIPKEIVNTNKYTDNTKAEFYLSLGLQHLGIDVAYEYMQYVISTYNPNNIISVGSGNGVFEKLLETNWNNLSPIQQKYVSTETYLIGLHIQCNINIICIDPNSDAFIKAPIKFKKEPIYPNIDDFLKIKPYNLMECVLILNWSTPNNSIYDYEAVIKLNPKIILWIGDPSGVAGGKLFLEFYKKCRTHQTKYKIIKEKVETSKDRFNEDIFYTIAILVEI